MKIKNNKRFSSLLLCMMLIVAMAFTSGCGKTEEKGGSQPSTSASQESPEIKRTVLGEGQTMFLFTVVDKDGNETEFEIHTDKKTVGDALLELKLIDGDDGDYGLYVKTVNGITADYDFDKTYWAFYVNGEYATAGVDSTDIEEGASYSFKVEK